MSAVTNIAWTFAVVIQQRFAKRLSDVLKVFGVEMRIRPGAERRTAK